mgnify:CR=1 FL=1
MEIVNPAALMKKFSQISHLALTNLMYVDVYFTSGYLYNIVYTHLIMTLRVEEELNIFIPLTSSDLTFTSVSTPSPRMSFMSVLKSSNSARALENM